MKADKLNKSQNPIWKTMTCILLSMFYFSMLAYPFGVSKEGYMANQVLIAGVIFFAISIPAWIINVKREFYSGEQEADETQNVAVGGHELAQQRMGVSLKVNSQRSRIGELALMRKWLTPKEIKQILFCQRGDCGNMFGEIAIKRNYLNKEQVSDLLAWQPNSQEMAVEKG